MFDIELWVDGDCGNLDGNASKSGGRFVPYPSSTNVARDLGIVSDRATECVSSSLFPLKRNIINKIHFIRRPGLFLGIRFKNKNYI